MSLKEADCTSNLTNSELLFIVADYSSQNFAKTSVLITFTQAVYIEDDCHSMNQAINSSDEGFLFAIFFWLFIIELRNIQQRGRFC